MQTMKRIEKRLADNERALLALAYKQLMFARKHKDAKMEEIALALLIDIRGY